MSLPLAGIRVLDLSRLLPGGFCSLLLADFGADVVKVEDTGMGDYVRWAGSQYEGVPASASSALFIALNRNKRSIRLDLKQAQGRETLLRLVEAFDVVLESFRPGVMDRLGVGYQRMRERNPGVVYCAISGYGQDGPNRHRAGHDMSYLALMGLLGLTGDRDGPPVQAAGQIADIGGGAMMAAFGIMAALRERDGAGSAPTVGGSTTTGSGEGQVVDVAMADGALSWLTLVAARYLAEDAVPTRGDLELAGSLICYRPYRCADGWMTLAALEPKFWAAWCRGVGREDLIEHQFDAIGTRAHRDVQEIFTGRDRRSWERFAQEHDCCLEPVLALDEALASEQVAARRMVVEIDQPGASRAVRQLGIPIKLGRTPGEHGRLPGPSLGEHTEQVLREAGCSAGEIESLLASGAAAGPSDAPRQLPGATLRTRV